MDITGVGIVATLKASNTFPSGFQISQFADDGDSLALEDMEIAGSAIGLNGDLITWAKAAATMLAVNIIPNGDDDKNLGVLFEANRAGRGKTPALDVITLSVVYPNGQSVTFNNGRLLKGRPANSVTSEGRMTSKQYSFAFESISKA